jgi:hypothetical protein
MTNPRMTAGERNELKTLANERARLAMTQVRSLAADRLVELNRQLEATWRAEDFQVRELLREMEKLAAEANTKIAARCDELGILPELRPHVSAGLGSPYMKKDRRAQLRQMAKDENEAAVKRAAHQIDTWKLETRTELVREGLTSDAAMLFLESMPGAADLLPAITADDLTRALSEK